MRFTIGIRRARIGAVLAAVTALVLIPSTAFAAWGNGEYAKSTFTAGTVLPPTAMTCTYNGASWGTVSFTIAWTAPAATTATRVNYGWQATGGASGSGTAAANATSLSLQIGGTATFTFSVWAIGQGTWTSTPLTRTVTVANNWPAGYTVSC